MLSIIQNLITLKAYVSYNFGVDYHIYLVIYGWEWEKRIVHIDSMGVVQD